MTHSQSKNDKALFDNIASQYARKDMLPATRIPRKYQLSVALQPIFNLTENLGSVLDVGSGIAAPAEYFNGAYDSYLGLDHSEAMVRAGQDFHKHRDNVTLITGDILNVDLSGKNFDLVLLCGALHHMPDVKSVLDKLHAYSKRGAWIVAIEPQRANPLIQCARYIRKKIDPAYAQDQYFFSRSELVRLFEMTNYRDISYQYQSYTSKPFGQVVLPFDIIMRKISKLTVHVDSFLDARMPNFLRFLSWDIIIRARFP